MGFSEEVGTEEGGRLYHGNVSPALTGRLALLIFFPFNSLEKAMSAETESISISSISDMLSVWLVREWEEEGFAVFFVMKFVGRRDWVDVTWKTRLGKREEQLEPEPPGKPNITRCPSGFTADLPQPPQHSKLLLNAI